MRGANLFRFLSLDRACGGRLLTGSQIKLSFGSNYFSSTSHLCEDSSSKQFPPNSSIVPQVVYNRNPRNLEKIRIGDKPSGWLLERESKSFWNKVTLDISSKHITASIVHYLGQRPITVSTKEWCVKKYLYSTNDASASKAVGDVLAQRCLQCGITEVACFFPEEDRRKEKVSIFLTALENGGVALKEPDQVSIEYNLHHHKPLETPWDVHEDVDDKFTASAKLRGWEVRKRNNPRKYEVVDETSSEVGIDKV